MGKLSKKVIRNETYSKELKGIPILMMNVFEAGNMEKGRTGRSRRKWIEEVKSAPETKIISWKKLFLAS